MSAAKAVTGDMASLLQDLHRLAGEHRLDALGVAPATPFESTLTDLRERKSRGLHGGMHFTYGNPERSTDPRRALPGAQSIVVGALSYRRTAPEGLASEGSAHGRVARYSWTDYYTPLRDALGVLAGELRSRGWRARVVADDNALVDREAAYRAGLGWYGKNSLVLLPRAGSYFVLGSVITDAPLPPAETTVPDGCGSCSRCMSACPTGALVEPGVVDANRCLAWLLEAGGWFPREHRRALGDRIYGCDDCQEACPPNRLADRKAGAPPVAPEAEAEVDLVWMLRLSDRELIDHFGRWYIPGRSARYLRRNALVALGNAADGFEPRVVLALRQCLRDRDPLVRGHAVWAAANLDRKDLLDKMGSDETDAGVLAELAAAS